MSRFRIYENGNRIRYEIINDKIYCIVITPMEWNTTGSRKISSFITYWVRQKKLGKNTPLKYGSVSMVDSIPDIVDYKCSECRKTYKTRSGFLKHAKTHHPDTSNESLVQDTSQPPISVNQTINNNNIQQNITIRPFGKENPKWITENLIVDTLRNMPCAIMNLVKEKHFNDRFPENRNVQMCNEFKNRYLIVQEDTRKAVQDRRQLFERMCSNACDAVTTTLESYAELPEEETENDSDNETPETRHCRQIANRLHRSEHFSSLVDRYIHRWEEYIANVQLDDVIKDADHYITMLLLDLKLALAHEEEMLNVRNVIV